MLYLVRHGQTEANARGQLLGRTDLPLDSLGQQQALAVAEALGAAVADGDEPCRVVTSPLQRTRQTAAAISQRLGVTVDVDERWVELDYGELEGVPMQQVPAHVWRTWRSDPAFTPQGGESLVALRKRVETALEDLVADASRGNVIVVSHVSPIKAAVVWALGVSDEAVWRLFVAPGSITKINTSGGIPALHGFNQVPNGAAR
ncbi:MAG: histidine phosphatase family protein [Acidimicrobiales bacterium]|nr:histidine phosphatase family protein [Acidimicrobiales bacterium]